MYSEMNGEETECLESVISSSPNILNECFDSQSISAVQSSESNAVAHEGIASNQGYELVRIEISEINLLP